MFFSSSPLEGLKALLESLKIQIGAFLEYIDIKDGYRYRFEKGFGFPPPKTQDIDKRKRDKVKNKLIDLAERALDAQEKFENIDYEYSFRVTIDDNDSLMSSSTKGVPDEFVVAAKRIRTYRRMKSWASQEGVQVSKIRRLKELDEKIEEPGVNSEKQKILSET